MGEYHTTHKPRIGQFNQSRSNMVHVSAEIVENQLKYKVLEEYKTAAQRAEHLANEGNMFEAQKAERLAQRLHAQYNAMPDRIVGKRSTFKQGRNIVKRVRAQAKKNAKFNRRQLAYKGSSPTTRTQSRA